MSSFSITEPRITEHGARSTALTRRGFLGSAAGLALYHGIPLIAQDAKPKKACIVLWMEGGPSQADTFDPKPGRGPFKPIDTAIAGASFSEHLPRVAKLADRMCVVRSVTSAEADHVRGSYYLHTGRPQGGLVVHPALGSVAAHFLRRDGVPGYVSVQCGRTVVGNGDYGPGFLGAAAAPLVVDRPEDPAALLRELDAKAPARAAVVEEMNAEFRRERPNENSDLRAALIDSAKRLKDSVVERALDLRGVKAEELARYAAPPRPKNPNLAQFAPACLVAKRLVAAGVPFVEVVLGGWDTHGYVAESVEELLRAVDPAMSALVEDLERERLLDSTLVAWMGEFGRTPWLNAAKGRDHYPKAFSAVLAGGGAARGRVVGATDAEGVEIARDPVTVPELFATIVALAGVDPDARYASKEQGVTRVAEARPVKAILA